MLKISKIARHTVVQMGACSKTPNNSGCPDVLTKMY
jgi:hypothetical protein